MNFKRLILSFLLTLLAVGSLFGNSMKGTEFWFGFMENQSSANGIDAFVSINSDVSTTGTIQIPGFAWSQNFVVAANTSIQITLPSNLVHNTGNMVISNKGVYIQTQDSVFVSLMSISSGSSDATAILPTYTLGYDYFATTYVDPPNTNWGTPEVLVVATENNTVLRISPSAALSNQQAVPFTVNLNKGQCYQIQSYWVNGSNPNGNDLSGTLIESICNNSGIKHPISVFSGDVCTIVGGANCSGCDHLVEHLQDYHTWGKQFAIVPPKDRNNYKLKVVAAYNGTTLSGNGITTQVLNSGQSAELSVSGQHFLSASQPVSVAQITYGQDCSPGYGDPMMSFIPPIDRLTKEWHYQSFEDGGTLYLHYLTIITPTSNTNNVFLDANLISSGSFSTLTGNANYSWVTLTMSGGTIPHNISSLGGFLAFPHGYTGAASYYLNSGVSMGNLKPNFSIAYLQDTTDYQDFNDTICACEPISFIADYYDTNAIVEWNFGDGFTAQGFYASHSYLNGNYSVTLIIRDSSGCVTDTLVKQNLVVVNCDISMSNNDTLCIGESVTLTANQGTSFIWSTGASTSSITVSPTTTTGYSLQVNGGNTMICDSIIVYVHPHYEIWPDDTLRFCEKDTAIVNGPSGLSSYVWNTGSMLSYIQVNSSGLYWLTVEDTNGCSTRDSIEVIIDSDLVWNLGPDIESCEGDTVVFLGPLFPNAHYTWSTSETTSSIKVSQAGHYSLLLQDGNCFTEDSVHVLFNTPPQSSLPAKIVLCETELLLEPQPKAIVNYNWSTGETSPSIIAKESGNYWVQMSNNCGSITNTIDLVFDCTYYIYIPKAFSPNADGINDFFKAEGAGIEEFEMYIYNRWGDLLFHTNDLNQQWNGLYKNKSAPIATYIWIIKVKDVTGKYHNLKGYFTIIK